jgi:hypothetical protein
LDLDVLLDRIKVQEATTYDITRELCMHLYHISPDFGTGLSLKEGVEWLGTNLVGEGKPYGGVLILFDEFSSFVRDYALRLQHRPGAPLQDLLNGVDSMRGRVAFVAFAQREPELIARSLLGGDSLQSLVTQLNRLPQPQHYQLHSSLEEVLAAYLKQNPDAWRKLLSNSVFSSALGHANDLCFDIFSSRYRDTLEWDVERFQEIVTQGCFPLHPATTALLSSVELETSNNPRSVLGFVSKHLDYLRNEPAAHGDVPTWVLPTTLVDYFREMLGVKNWDNYCDALGQAGGPDASPDQIAVLKAMLLQTACSVATRGAYNRVIAQFAGLSPEHAANELKSLAASGVIRFDSTRHIYTFWPAGKGANKVDQILSDKLQGCILDGPTLDTIIARLKSEGLLGDISVPIPWGHQDDWWAEQLIASRHTFNIDAIQKKVIDRIFWRSDGTTLPRGLVVWMIAESPEDTIWLRDSASDVLSKSFPDQSVPIVLMKPGAAEPDLAKQLLRLYGLTEFSNADIAEVGQEQHAALLLLTIEALRSGLKSLAEDSEIEVPAPFKARINSARISDIESVVAEVYKMAYNEGPRRWFTHYKQSSTKLRNATERVATYLLSNALNTPGIFAADNVARDVAQQLKSEWALLADDLRIRQPQATSNVRPAWDLLERSFPAGSASRGAAQAVEQLLNVPYGYDHNTLSLVFAAWLGFHRHDLEVSVGGQLQQIRTIGTGLKPKELVGALAGLSIKKTDADAVRSQVRQMLEKADRGSFTKTEAEDALQLFAQAMERDDVDQRAAIQIMSTKITGALELAEQYDKNACEIERLVETQKSLAELARVLVRLASLTVPETVKPDKPAPGELRSRIIERIGNVTEANCRLYQNLTSIVDFKLNEQQLLLIQGMLSKLQLPDQVARVDSALETLRTAKGQLERVQQDETSMAVLRSIESRGELAQLRKSIVTIEKMTLFSEATKKFAEERLGMLRREVKRLEDFRTNIPERIAAVVDLRGIDEVKSDILINLNLFDASTEGVELQRSLERCQQLRLFLEEVEAVRHKVVQTPIERDEIIERLHSCSREYSSWLSAAQVALVPAAIAAVELSVGRLSEAAVKWLSECERALGEGGNLAELATRLKMPPAFLSETLRPKLIELDREITRSREAEQLKATLLDTLKTISGKGTLIELKQQASMVEAIPAPTAALQQLVQEKLAVLHREVKRLEDFKTAVPGRLDAVLDLTSLEEVKSDILRKCSLFDGSEEAAEFRQSLERCKQLQDYFEAVDIHRRDVALTPVDATQNIAQLALLSRERAPHLSAAQLAVASDVIAEIEKEVEKQSQAATKWLSECSNALSQGVDLDTLSAKLKKPPAFLTEAQLPQLEELSRDVNRRAESKQQEAAILAVLKNVPMKGSLVVLNQQVSTVEALPLPTEAVQRLVQEKLAVLRHEVERLKEIKATLPNRLDDVRDFGSLEEIKSDILRNASIFDGTEDAAELQEFLKRCQQLRVFIEALEEIRHAVIHTPVDAIQNIERLTSLSRECAPHLSVVQVGLTSDAIAKIDTEMEKQAQAAVDWLRECKKGIVDGGDVLELAQKLKSPPPFLPEDSKPLLLELVQETNRRIDDDEILQVEMHFRKIADLPKRLECLNRLSTLIDGK